MKNWGIQTRILLLALAPAVVIAVALSIYFVLALLSDLDRNLQEQGLALSRQLAAIAEYCRQQGAAEVLMAALVEKLHLRKVTPGMRADFSGIEVGDRFLFGYGLDYKGYWRNAPGIYAVKGL